MLLNEAGLTIHSVDHIVHGMICCRVLVYHFYGWVPMLLCDLVTVPFTSLLSDNFVKVQLALAPGACKVARTDAPLAAISAARSAKEA